ncbi:MAG: hypothetical protein P1V81_05775 [Planctomycetota bacterium]|nr:hypothetical protein [Planctomycetota bacterium]
MDILPMAVDRHGGARAFRSVDAIDLRILGLDGLVLRYKGLGRSFQAADRVVVRPHHGVATFHFGDHTIAYERGAVQTPTERTEGHRSRFAGLGKLRPWTPADACYFLGYALVNYLSLPFLLADLPVRRSRVLDDGSAWVESVFPAGADTHCRVQRFWFDSTGLLVRHDYRADILGPMFQGAHFSLDHDLDHGIPLARTRVVKARLGSLASPLAILRAKLQVESVGRAARPSHPAT